MFISFRASNSSKDLLKANKFAWFSVVFATLFPMYYLYDFFAVFLDLWLFPPFTVIIPLLSGPGAILFGIHALLLKTNKKRLIDVLLATIGIGGGIIAFSFFLVSFLLSH